MVPINSYTIVGAFLILTVKAAMPQQTPTSTVRALYDAVSRRDWMSAAVLADSESLVAWHRDERASLANLLLSIGPEELHGADTAAVDAILRQNANAALRLPGMSPTTLGTIGSLSARDYLVRLWEVLDEVFGRAEPKAPAFGVVGEETQNDGTVRVQYRGYLGIGGGMPESLELRRAGSGWRYVIIPELTSPNFAVLVGALGGIR